MLAPGRRVRVLLVLDWPDDGHAILKQLDRQGLVLEHRVVASGEAFAAALAEGSWDVVLSDFSPSYFDGLRASDLDLAKSAGVPLIFVAGHIGEDRAVETVLRGASDYVLKSRLSRLAPAIERVLAARDVIQPVIVTANASTPRQVGAGSSVGSAAGAGPGLEATCSSKSDFPSELLTAREREVLTLVSEGRTGKEIARTLNLSAKTVAAHRASLMAKVRIRSIVGLVRYAVRQGLIRP